MSWTWKTNKSTNTIKPWEPRGNLENSLKAREDTFPEQGAGKRVSLLHYLILLNWGDPHTLMVCRQGDSLVYIWRGIQKRAWAEDPILRWKYGPGELSPHNPRGHGKWRLQRYDLKLSSSAPEVSVAGSRGNGASCRLSAWNPFPYSLTFKYLIAPQPPVKLAPNTPPAQYSLCLNLLFQFSFTNPL